MPFPKVMLDTGLISDIILCFVLSSLFFIKIMKSCTKTRESSLQWLFKSRLFCLALGMFAISLALWPTPPLKSLRLKALPSATLFCSKYYMEFGDYRGVHHTYNQSYHVTGLNTLDCLPPCLMGFKKTSVCYLRRDCKAM